MTLPDLSNAENFALFFDFDGTLADIAERPDAVKVSEITRSTLGALQSALHGAVAIISGREIASVDQFLAPACYAISGVHGLMRRDGAGILHAPDIDLTRVDGLEERLAPFVAAHPGLLLERKSGAIALHFRQRPDLEAAAHTAMRGAADGAQFRLRPGKMVIEALAHHSDKGLAIESFMREAPFLGRIPVFAGDDVTDEDGFAYVNRHKGISIKVGAGDSQAHFRASGTEELLFWLMDLRKKLEGDSEQS